MSLNFQASLKPRSVEEFLDYYFYRRLAFLLVPTLIRFGLAPNQITTLSLLTGWLGSYLVLQRQFVSGSFVLILAIVFDCCDGQVARLTGKSSPIGRHLDGAFDFLWVLTFWLAVYFSEALPRSLYPNQLSVLLFSGFFTVIHCFRFDSVKMQKLKLCGDEFLEGSLKVSDIWEEVKISLKQFNVLVAFALFLALLQAWIFGDRVSREQGLKLSAVEKQQRNQILEPALADFSWLGEGHHNSLLILGILFVWFSPSVLWFCLGVLGIVMNLWWIYCEVRWFCAWSRVKKLAS